MSQRDYETYFERAIALSNQALETGNDGFGCVLVGPDGDILLEQGNVVSDEGDPTAHDVMALVRRAVKQFDGKTRAGCTIYATMEPCVMCMGAAFWAGIPRVRYAVSEEEMEQILPGGLQIHSGEFCRRSPKPMECLGPVEGPVYDQAYDVMRRWVNRVLGK